LSLFYAAVAKYHRLDNFQTMEFYLAYTFGDWEVQEPEADVW
jgi:hypothetical protein